MEKRIQNIEASIKTLTSVVERLTETVKKTVDKLEMEIKETATGGVETPINRFVLAHNENAKELGSAINRLDTKINQTATAMETVEEHLGEKTASEKKENNAEEAIKEKKMNAAQTIQKMYRSRRFLRRRIRP